ncbi:hypothetical protein KGF57_005305 [Candida theae]|uniref:SH3 domain-containing protein n=1 Tax=Candida theae TaxID=1198502 RepID=A0AAD5BAF5_9ASCO|nr:uncharacterized protein KGF57_005305 [Candida theae]KAI5948694.1 hypothetical protein KGF57_005305 [Candida theae]
MVIVSPGLMSNDKVLQNGDRFIPTSSSMSAYKVLSGEDSNSLTNQSKSSEVSFSIREDSFVSGVIHSPTNLSPSPRSITSSSSTGSSSHPRTVLKPNDLHQEVVAEALNLNYCSKVLKFNNIYTHQPPKNPGSYMSNPIEKIINKSTTKKPKLKVKSVMASDILQAPGLRNDYYSNLISWSPKTNRVIVGLASRMYLWGADSQVVQINYENDDLITAVSCSQEYWILVATANGKILLIDQGNEVNSVVGEFNVPENKCIFCFTWFNDSKHFLAGNDSGEVHVMRIKTLANLELEIIKTFRAHQQQICALNATNDEVAVGANDNCCSLWSLPDYHSPQLKFVLPHKAAIKALSFCPWTGSLLATGGGSKDRKIRFWHTTSGTLLKEFYTDGQITSLIWSKYKKEIVATFGFGGSTKSNLMRVYSYPEMTPSLEVNATSNLRILSATTSPDFCSVCVATNDSTIRIYHLWDRAVEISPTSSSRITGAYGSDIIELAEGVIRTELEFLRDSEVITDALYTKLVEALPQKYKKNEKPWDVDALSTGSVSKEKYSAPPSEPPAPAYEAKSSKLAEEFANTHISPPDHPPAPHRSTPKPVGYCTASFDYAAQEPDDLNLSKGDKLAVVEHLSEDWWKGYKAGSDPEKAGVFPSNYVTVISEAEFTSSENRLAASRPLPSHQNSQSSYGPPAYYQPPLSNQPSYGGYAQYPPPSTGYYPPPQQYQQTPPPPQQVVVAPEQQQQQSSGHGHLKKYGSRFGEAALFGAGASVGANIVNSIL